MAAQEQSGPGAQPSTPAAPSPPAPPAAPSIPPIFGVPNPDAINRAVEQKFEQRVEQARQRLEQAKEELTQATTTYASKRNSENKGRVNDAKEEVKDATREYQDAVTQSVSGRLSGQDGITIDLGGSRRRSSDSSHNSASGEVVPIVFFVFLFLYLIVRAIMAPFSRKNRGVQSSQPGNFAGGGFSQEEVALIQKMQRTLNQMETRVEALETILIEQQQASSARSRRMAGATVGAIARAASAPSSATLRSNPNI